MKKSQFTEQAAPAITGTVGDRRKLFNGLASAGVRRLPGRFVRANGTAPGRAVRRVHPALVVVAVARRWRGAKRAATAYGGGCAGRIAQSPIYIIGLDLARIGAKGVKAWQHAQHGSRARYRGAVTVLVDVVSAAEQVVVPNKDRGIRDRVDTERSAAHGTSNTSGRREDQVAVNDSSTA